MDLRSYIEAAMILIGTYTGIIAVSVLIYVVACILTGKGLI